VVAPAAPTPAKEVATTKASTPVAATSQSGNSSEPASPRTGQVVEVMALSHESDAEIMVAALNRHGYDVAVHHDAQNSLFHLDVGPFTNTKDAESMRQRLLLDGYNATIK